MFNLINSIFKPVVVAKSIDSYYPLEDLPPLHVNETEKWFSEEDILPSWKGIVDTISQSVPTMQMKAFSKGLIARKIFGAVTLQLGGWVGSTNPEAFLCSNAAMAVASKVLKESENKSKEIALIGAFAGLSVIVLKKGVEAYVGAEFQHAPFSGYFLEKIGYILGGMNALKAIGQELSLNDSPRLGASLVAADATRFIGGPILSCMFSWMAYYGPETKTIARHFTLRHWPINYSDPGELAKVVVIHAKGDIDSVFETINAKFIGSKLLASQSVKKLLRYGFDKKIGTNALVRAVNDYADLLKDVDLTRAFDPLEHEKLKQEMDHLATELYWPTQRTLASFSIDKIEASLPGAIEQVVEWIKTSEIAIWGFVVSNLGNTRNLLKILLPRLIFHIAVFTRRESSLLRVANLSYEELESFYKNCIKALFYPYKEYRLGQILKAVATWKMLVVQQVQFIPKLMAESLGESLIEAVDKMKKESKKPLPLALNGKELLPQPQLVAATFVKIKSSWFSFLERLHLALEHK